MYKCLRLDFWTWFFFWHVAYFVFYFILIHWPGLGFLGLQAISSAIINIIWLKMKKKIIYFFSYWKKTYIICYNFNYQLFLVFFISWSQCISNHISAVVSLLTGHSCQRPPLIIRPDFRYTDSKLLLYFPPKERPHLLQVNFFSLQQGWPHKRGTTVWVYV